MRAVQIATIALGLLPVILAPPACAQYYTPEVHYNSGHIERDRDDVWFYRQLDQNAAVKAERRRAYDAEVDRMNDQSDAERRHKEIMRTLRSIVDE